MMPLKNIHCELVTLLCYNADLMTEFKLFILCTASRWAQFETAGKKVTRTNESLAHYLVLMGKLIQPVQLEMNVSLDVSYKNCPFVKLNTKYTISVSKALAPKRLCTHCPPYKLLNMFHRSWNRSQTCLVLI